MLKKTLLSLVMVSALAASADAALIAHWDFDGYTGSTTPSPEGGTGTLTIDPMTASLSAGTGTTINDPDVTPTDTASLHLAGNSGAINGTLFTIQVSGTGLDSFIVTYAAQALGGGPDRNTWSWSTDGSSFTDLGGFLTVANDFVTSGTITADFSGVTALNNAPTVYLRNTLSGAGGNNKTADFDNIQVTAVPEPINVALVLFGLTFCGVTFGRRLIGFARA